MICLSTPGAESLSVSTAQQRGLGALTPRKRFPIGVLGREEVPGAAVGDPRRERLVPLCAVELQVSVLQVSIDRVFFFLLFSFIIALTIAYIIIATLMF